MTEEVQKYSRKCFSESCWMNKTFTLVWIVFAQPWRRFLLILPSDSNFAFPMLFLESLFSQKQYWGGMLDCSRTEKKEKSYCIDHILLSAGIFSRIQAIKLKPLLLVASLLESIPLGWSFCGNGYLIFVWLIYLCLASDVIYLFFVFLPALKKAYRGWTRIRI